MFTLGDGDHDAEMPGLWDFEVLVAWADWLEAQGYSSKTIRLYSYGVFRLVTEQRVSRLNDVREEHVTRFLASIGDRAVARTHYLRGIRSLFTYAVPRGHASVDPTAGIRLRKPSHRPAVALTEDELARVMVAAAWRDPRRAWTLLLSLGIGCRRMEVAGITPDDVDLPGGTVLLRHCKGGRQRRVELSTQAREALLELRPWWNGTVLGGVSAQTITEWAHQAADDAGLLAKVQSRPHHVLRASFISHHLRNGTPVEVVRDLVGHLSIATTNTYAVTFDGDRRLAQDRFLAPGDR